MKINSGKMVKTGCLLWIAWLTVTSMNAQGTSRGIQINKSAAVLMRLEVVDEDVDGYAFKTFVLKGDERFTIEGSVDPRWKIEAEGKAIAFKFAYDKTMVGTIEVFPVGRAFPNGIIYPNEIVAYVNGLKLGWLKGNSKKYFELVEGMDTDFFPTDAPKPREIRDVNGKLLGVIESEAFLRMLGHDYFQLSYEWGERDEEGVVLLDNRTTEWWSLPPGFQVRIRFTSESIHHDDLRKVFQQYLKQIDFVNRKEVNGLIDSDESSK